MMRNHPEWIDRDSIENYVYIIGRLDEAISTVVGTTKVGVSQDPWHRLKQLQAYESDRLLLVAWFAFWKRSHAIRVERAFHKTCHVHRDKGEWFDMPPSDAVAIMGGVLLSFVENVLGTNNTADFFTAHNYLSVPGFNFNVFPSRYNGDIVWQ